MLSPKKLRPHRLKQLAASPFQLFPILMEERSQRLTVIDNSVPKPLSFSVI